MKKSDINSTRFSFSVTVWYISLFLLSVLVLITDLMTQLGVAGGVPYVSLILLAALNRQAKIILITACVATLLTLVGWLLSEPGSPHWMVITNRLYALLVIWLSAFFLMYYYRTDELLHQSAAILFNCCDHISLVDKNYVYREVNNAYLDAHNKKRDEIVGKSVSDLLGDDVFENIRHSLDKGLSGENVNFQAWFHFSNSGKRYMDVSYVPFFKQDGKVDGIVVSSRDITSKKEVDERLALERSRLYSIINNIPDPIFFQNTQFVIENCNIAFLKLLGKSKQEIIGRTDFDLHPSTLATALNNACKHSMEWHVPIKLEEEIENNKKNKCIFDITITSLGTQDRDNLGLIGIAHDITERKQNELRIQKLALTDSLTGLANRTHFNSCLAESFCHSKRCGCHVGLMILDMDKFKPVNDTFGHLVGDLLLVHVAKLLIKRFREVDLVARIGGDEFAVVLKTLEDNYDVTEIAKKIIDEFSQPFIIDKHKIKVGISIGISIYPVDATDVNSLLKNADDALYEAKHNGRNTYHVHQ